MEAVAVLAGAILQTRNVTRGETVGYSATWTAPRDVRIAVLGAGYKDGVPRALSSGVRNSTPEVFLGGKRCPIIGRVSMDMMAIDITDLAMPVKRGDLAEILGSNILIDEVAGWAGTISYELLTRLGSRYARLYSQIDSETQA
jgi:alanine racemase